MSDKPLRKAIIRLAAARPELRPVLLPLVAPSCNKMAAGDTDIESTIKGVIGKIGRVFPEIRRAKLSFGYRVPHDYISARVFVDNRFGSFEEAGDALGKALGTAFKRDDLAPEYRERSWVWEIANIHACFVDLADANAPLNKGKPMRLTVAVQDTSEAAAARIPGRRLARMRKWNVFGWSYPDEGKVILWLSYPWHPKNVSYMEKNHNRAVTRLHQVASKIIDWSYSNGYFIEKGKPLFDLYEEDGEQWIRAAIVLTGQPGLFIGDMDPRKFDMGGRWLMPRFKMPTQPAPPKPVR